MTDWRELTLDAEDALLRARRAENQLDQEVWLEEAQLKIRQAKKSIRGTEKVKA